MKNPLIKLTELRVSSFITELNNTKTVKGGSHVVTHAVATNCCDTTSGGGSSAGDPNGCPAPVSEEKQLTGR